MIRRPPRSTLDRSSAASDVYKRQEATLQQRLSQAPGLSDCGERSFRGIEEAGYLWPGVGSVSYTHLRAHEAVLDLVCRLLLETKTNTTPDNEI